LTPDGKQLVVRQTDRGKTGLDLLLLPLDPVAPSKPLIQTPFNELNGEVSPDGRWLAYQSDESGQRMEIFVRPFPAVDTGKWQVTSEGGLEPAWSPSGRELFFRSVVGGTMKLLAAPVPAQPAGSIFVYGKPEVMFPLTGYLGVGGGVGQRSYDISPDGRRFLMVKTGETAALRSSITVVSHWFDELRARVPVK
jgi:dipeptidyl aminopeptidase/acylaminoacyl peptidase